MSLSATAPCFFNTSPGTGTPSLPWTACSSALPLFQRRNARGRIQPPCLQPSLDHTLYSYSVFLFFFTHMTPCPSPKLPCSAATGRCSLPATNVGIRLSVWLSRDSHATHPKGSHLSRFLSQEHSFLKSYFLSPFITCVQFVQK